MKKQSFEYFVIREVKITELIWNSSARYENCRVKVLVQMKERHREEHICKRSSPLSVASKAEPTSGWMFFILTARLFAFSSSFWLFFLPPLFNALTPPSSLIHDVVSSSLLLYFLCSTFRSPPRLLLLLPAAVASQAWKACRPGRETKEPPPPPHLSAPCSPAECSGCWEANVLQAEHEKCAHGLKYQTGLTGVCWVNAPAEASSLLLSPPLLNVVNDSFGGRTEDAWKETCTMKSTDSSHGDGSWALCVTVKHSQWMWL